MVVKKPKKPAPNARVESEQVQSYNAVLIEEVHSQMQLVIEKVESMEVSLTERIQESESRLSQRLDLVELATRRNSEQLSEHGKQLTALDKKIDEVHADLGGKIDRLTTTVERHDDDIAALKEASLR